MSLFFCFRMQSRRIREYGIATHSAYKPSNHSLCLSYRVQNVVGKKELRMYIAVDRVNIKTFLCIKCLLHHFRVCGEEFFLA